MATFRKFDETRPRCDFFEYFTDFTSVSNYTAGDWTITNTGTPTIAVGLGVTNGVLEMTTGTSSGDNTYHDNKISDYRFVVGKALEFETRFKLDSVLLPDFVLGLQITDTTPLAVSDGIWFQNDTGDALLDMHVAKASVQSDAIGIATLVDDTFVKAGFYYDGTKSVIQAFINDNRVASLPITNAPTTQNLCISMGVKTNAAAARKLSIDYLRIRAER